jgi:hypothetical protein
LSQSHADFGASFELHRKYRRPKPHGCNLLPLIDDDLLGNATELFILAIAPLVQRDVEDVIVGRDSGWGVPRSQMSVRRTYELLDATEISLLSVLAANGSLRSTAGRTIVRR